MKVSKLFVVLAIGLFMAGCASSLKQTPDGKYIGITTVDDGPDRSASFVQLLEKDAEGNYVQVVGDLTVGPTIAGQALVGATQGTGVALIQGYAANKVADKKADAIVKAAEVNAKAYTEAAKTNANAIVEATQINAEAQKCPEGTEVCNSMIIGGATANAGSKSLSESSTDVDISSGWSGCPDEGCVGVSMD